MNATSLLVSTTRLVLQAEANGSADSANLSDLFRLVPYLRQSLSCTVCGSLLIEPYTPQATQCQHHVCRTCLGGRKALKPTCHSCGDYQKYEVNTQLRILLQCYKGLCEYIVSKPIYAFVMGAGSGGQHQTNNVVSNGNVRTSSLASNSLVELIEEGARFKDNYKSNSGQLKSAYSMLPCVYNSLPMPQVSHHAATEAPPFANVNAPPISAAPVPTTIRKISTTLSHTSHATTTSSSSATTSVDVKPDIKTFNLVRSPHSHPPKHKTHIQLASHQTPVHQVVQPIRLHQQPAPNNSSPQHQKQKIWISSLQNHKPQVGRSTIVPVPNTSYHIQQSPQPSAPAVANLVPPPKPTSNGSSPMYSVLYAGTGNKITIKRKPDPVDIKDYPNVRLNPPAPNVNTTAAAFAPPPSSAVYTDHKLPALVQSYQLPIPSTTTVRPHNPFAMLSSKPFVPQMFLNMPAAHQTPLQHVAQPVQTTTFRPQQHQQQTMQQQQHQQQPPQNFKKPVMARSKSLTAAAAAKRKGCRCGNATPTPGKLTCCGQRCPCYVEAKSCVDCKCRGCRNPHRADGLKVRPHIPELNAAEPVTTATTMDYASVSADRLVSSGNSSSSGSSSGSNSSSMVGATSFATLPTGTHSTATTRSLRTTLASTINRLDGIDADTLQSLDQDSIVFNPDDVEDTNFQVVNVFTSHMPSMNYSALPTMLVQDPSHSFYSTSPSTATLSATPQINLLATDDDDEDDEDANDLLSTTLRATPTLVQKYRTSLLSTTPSGGPSQQLLYEASMRQFQRQQQQPAVSSATLSQGDEEEHDDDDEQEDEDDDDEEDDVDEVTDVDDEEGALDTSDEATDEDDVDV